MDCVVSATDGGGSRSQHRCHVGVELVDKSGISPGRHVTQAVGKFPERLITHALARITAFLLNRLWGKKGEPCSVGGQQSGYLGLAADIGPQDIRPEGLVIVIVHAEVY